MIEGNYARDGPVRSSIGARPLYSLYKPCSKGLTFLDEHVCYHDSVWYVLRKLAFTLTETCVQRVVRAVLTACQAVSHSKIPK